MQKLKHVPKELSALIIILALILGISLFEWNKKPSDQYNSPLSNTQLSLQQEKEDGNVTVLVEYQKEQSDQQMMEFKIALDTHSVTLDDFDFGKDITLEKDGKSFSPKVVSQEGSSHHRSGELTFPLVNTPFTIVVKNLSQVARREFYFEQL